MNTTPPRKPRIDVHVHLAGVGTQGSGCWASPTLLRRPSFIGLRLLHRISPRQMENSVDQDWAASISAAVAASDLDFAVVLGFDGAYDSTGRFDSKLSQMLVPSGWVFEVCSRYQNLLPAPSINPYRRDALDELESVIELGAVMIKWLPIVQGFDPAAPRTLPFLRRLADAGVPLLVHAGTGELTFRTIDGSVGGLDRLVPALEAGVKVICAHTAAPIVHSREQNQLPMLFALLKRFPNLWVDNSGLANPSRFAHLPRFGADPLLQARTLHGSDYPIPSTSIFFPRRLGARGVARIERIRNPFQKQVELNLAIGYPEASLVTANSVLANLERWLATPRQALAPAEPTP